MLTINKRVQQAQAQLLQDLFNWSDGPLPTYCTRVLAASLFFPLELRGQNIGLFTFLHVTWIILLEIKNILNATHLVKVLESR